MLSAKELRIGNWVKHTNTFCKEEMELDFELMKLEYNEMDKCYPELIGIHLSEDILIKCGFEYNKFDILTHYNLKCRWVTNNLSEELIDVPFLRFDGIVKPPQISTDIYYLHQLQNITFALTGKELIINI